MTINTETIKEQMEEYNKRGGGSATASAGYSQADRPATTNNNSGPIPPTNPNAIGPMRQQAVGGQGLNPAETADYRDLLNRQLMTESSKANASKYISQAMQASGVGQTGLAQSVLSGIEMGYQNLAAQNVANFNLQQQQQQFESEQATLSREEQAAAESQSATAQIAFNFLEGASSLESLQRYYDEYYNDLNEEQRRAFDLVFEEKQRELGFVSAPDEAELESAFTSFSLPNGGSANYVETNEVASFIGNLVDAAQDLTSEASKTAANNLLAAFNSSANWGNNRNGTVYKITTGSGDTFYGFYNGKWYKITGRKPTPTRTFTIR